MVKHTRVVSYQFHIASSSVCIANGHLVVTGGRITLQSLSVALYSLSVLYSQRTVDILTKVTGSVHTHRALHERVLLNCMHTYLLS